MSQNDDFGKILNLWPNLVDHCTYDFLKVLILMTLMHVGTAI